MQTFLQFLSESPDRPKTRKLLRWDSEDAHPFFVFRNFIIVYIWPWPLVHYEMLEKLHELAGKVKAAGGEKNSVLEKELGELHGFVIVGSMDAFKRELLSKTFETLQKNNVHKAREKYGLFTGRIWPLTKTVSIWKDSYAELTSDGFAKLEELIEYLGGKPEEYAYDDALPVYLDDRKDRKTATHSEVLKMIGNPTGHVRDRYDAVMKESVSIRDVEAITRNYLNTIWKKWSEQYPEEPGIEDPAYMEPEFLRTTYGLGKWIFDQIDTGNYSESATFAPVPKDAASCSTKIGRCYYNALDFVNKNGTKCGDLVFAFFFDQRDLEKAEAWSRGHGDRRPFLFDGLKHALIRTKDGKFIDPTLGDDERGKFVVYEIVPENVWKKFRYKPDDKDYDARAFYDDYIVKKMDTSIPNFAAWMSKKTDLKESVKIKSGVIKDEDFIDYFPKGHPIFEWPRDKVIYLSHIENDSPGSGEGSTALKKFLADSDTRGEWVVLDVVPENEDMRPRLIKWYQRHGFIFSGSGGGTMHRPPSSLKESKKTIYYHGTSEEAGQKIIEDGFISPGKITTKKSRGLQPVDGKVYMTQDVAEALAYSFMKSGWGSLEHQSRSIEDKHQFAYLFVCQLEDSAPVQPDEDIIADEIAKGNEKWLINLAKEKFPGLSLKYKRDGNYSYGTELGKGLMKYLTPEQKARLIELGKKVAHDGQVKILEAWKIYSTMRHSLKNNPENFRRVSKRVDKLEFREETEIKPGSRVNLRGNRGSGNFWEVLDVEPDGYWLAYGPEHLPYFFDAAEVFVDSK